MVDEVMIEDVEPIEIVEGARDVEFDEIENCFWWACHHSQVVHVEMAAGGGGGGGSAKGGNGGSGGKAGEYKFVRVELDPGRYRIAVGDGGRGGRSFQKNESDDPATAGTDSFLQHSSGLTLVHCLGGAAGQLGGGPQGTSGGGSGSPGQDVVSKWGVTIASGGYGGPTDRPGGGGEFPGAGGGGSGIYRGPSNFYAGNGGKGRVRITRIS